jgi:transposase-like protein
MVEWQNRALDPVYPVIFMDCVHVKARDGQVTNRPIYVALAVTVNDTRDILGLWAVRARGHFPSEAAALKCIYMAVVS